MLKTYSREDTFHKKQMFNLLTEILNDKDISSRVIFKGGTCASILGYLDRFSVDLDFDLYNIKDRELVDKRLKLLVGKLDFEIKDKSKETIQYFLKYKTGIN